MLLHSFVNTCSVMLVHLVELIDQADTLVSKYQGSSFENPFLSDRVLVDTSSETDCTSSFSSSVYDSVVDLLDVLKELRLGGTRVSEKQHIDVASDSVLTVPIFGFSSEHGQGESLLDELVSVNRGGDRVDNLVAYTGGS